MSLEVDIARTRQELHALALETVEGLRALAKAVERGVPAAELQRQWEVMRIDPVFGMSGSLARAVALEGSSRMVQTSDAAEAYAERQRRLCDRKCAAAGDYER